MASCLDCCQRRSWCMKTLSNGVEQRLLLGRRQREVLAHPAMQFGSRFRTNLVASLCRLLHPHTRFCPQTQSGRVQTMCLRGVRSNPSISRNFCSRAGEMMIRTRKNSVCTEHFWKRSAATSRDQARAQSTDRARTVPRVASCRNLIPPAGGPSTAGDFVRKTGEIRKRVESSISLTVLCVCSISASR